MEPIRIVARRTGETSGHIDRSPLPELLATLVRLIREHRALRADLRLHAIMEADQR